VDLGGFRQYVHRRDPSRRVELLVELDGSVLTGHAASVLGREKSAKVTLNVGMPLDDIGQPIPGQLTRLIFYSAAKRWSTICVCRRVKNKPCQLARDRLADVVQGHPDVKCYLSRISPFLTRSPHDLSTHSRQARRVIRPSGLGRAGGRTGGNRPSPLRLHPPGCEKHPTPRSQSHGAPVAIRESGSTCRSCSPQK